MWFRVNFKAVKTFTESSYNRIITHIVSLHYTCIGHNSTQDGSSLHHRIRLDRRRFESAHLKYAVLATQNRYPHITADLIPMHTDIASTLENFAPLFYTALTQTYSGHT